MLINFGSFNFFRRSSIARNMNIERLFRYYTYQFIKSRTTTMWKNSFIESYTIRQPISRRVFFFFQFWNWIISPQISQLPHCCATTIYKKLIAFSDFSVYINLHSKGPSIWIDSFEIVARVLCCFEKV